jgi:hypothetical protein
MLNIHAEQFDFGPGGGVGVQGVQGVQGVLESDY